MALLDSYIRGVSSIQLELTLTDIDTGLPIDISTLTDVSVEIIRFNQPTLTNTIFWTGTILTGEVITLVAASGTLACYIDPSEHTTWPLVTGYHVRVIASSIDVNFTSGVKTVTAIIEAFKLVKE